MIRTLFAIAALLATPATAQETGDGQYVDINGMKMYYEVTGSGEPIVVLHGAYMNIDTMGEIIPRLAETRTVYALEFQGHGRTNDIASYFSIQHTSISFLERYFLIGRKGRYSCRKKLSIHFIENTTFTRFILSS